jgi:chemotaxis protein CheD
MSYPSAAQERRRGSALPRRFLNPQDGCWHVQITQGETHVTDNPQELLTTILGSCIAACIRDPQMGVGGMNHFLLPNSDGEDRDATRYGVNAMELLINGLLKKGASRARLEAKLFGGANVLAGLSDVGSRNAAFAEKYLADEGITVVGGDIRGSKPRRIQYWPISGRARQLAMPPIDSTQLVQRELAKSRQIRKPEPAGGDDVELF